MDKNEHLSFLIAFVVFAAPASLGWYMALRPGADVGAWGGMSVSAGLFALVIAIAWGAAATAEDGHG